MWNECYFTKIWVWSQTSYTHELNIHLILSSLPKLTHLHENIHILFTLLD